MIVRPAAVTLLADDIAVRFYEQDEDGNIKWEDYGYFAPHDVHRQVRRVQ